MSSVALYLNICQSVHSEQFCRDAVINHIKLSWIKKVLWLHIQKIEYSLIAEPSMLQKLEWGCYNWEVVVSRTQMQEHKRWAIKLNTQKNINPKTILKLKVQQKAVYKSSITQGMEQKTRKHTTGRHWKTQEQENNQVNHTWMNRHRKNQAHRLYYKKNK